MGFDDLFERGHKHHKQGFDHHERYDDDCQSSHSYNHYNDIKQQFLTKLQNNPNLKILLIVAAIVILIIIVVVAIVLIPLLLKLLSFISENGLQGLIDAIWKGTK